MNRMSMEYSVKNTFGMLVYSKKCTWPTLFIVVYLFSKILPQTINFSVIDLTPHALATYCTLDRKSTVTTAMMPYRCRLTQLLPFDSQCCSTTVTQQPFWLSVELISLSLIQSVQQHQVKTETATVLHLRILQSLHLL